MNPVLFFALFFGFSFLGFGCTEKAVENITARHAGGEKRTSVWAYSDGTIKKVNEWYLNGIKETEIPYKDGLPHGNYTRWSVRGSVANTGKFRRGKKEGKWVSWFDNKKKESFGNYRRDEKHGVWKGFYYFGEPAFEEIYEQGNPVGIWKYWNKNGVLVKETSCFETNENGFTALYSQNGKKEYEEECRFGVVHGFRKTYYPGGALLTEAHFKNGVLHGKSADYLATGQVIRETFWNAGVRDSLWKWFDFSGKEIQNSAFHAGTGTAYGFSVTPENFALIAESSFVENKQSGVLRSYPLQSRLNLEEIWENGVLKESRSYFRDSAGGNSALAGFGFWKNGKKEGAWVRRYSNGVLRDSLNYREGEPYGGQFYYDSTGKLMLHKEQAGKTGATVVHLPKNF